ncbi:MAG: prolipoprotein diacylglyceryl transferase [Gammaproteobacteria bacterium RIFCSPHIGHO2_12_FULL_37_34]|nr:MAG: prolipoprotein diacylglyceryl transferase [Gammaproteobacteria bacterium RIFCSPHIGHO2_12_FULL_37_34]
MLIYPSMDPVAFHIGSWPVYWYGLMYLIGFFAGWGVLSWRLHVSPRDITQEQLSDIVFYAALGAIIGGRLGYILFYDWRVLVSDPLLILQIWKGGMSFHGGVIGVLLAMFICAKKLHQPFLALTDLLAPAVPIGLGAGRIGNFINDELWGRITTMPWGMVFPNAGMNLRHPSQLYEFFLEGIILFFILWIYSSKPRPLGVISGWFAIGYGVFRFFVEFFREPDVQIGFVAFGWMTEGQLLSLPLILVGIGLMLWSYRGNLK